MKALWWTVLTAVLLVWTALAWLLSASATWLSQGLQAGADADGVAWASSLNIPAWLVQLFDAGWVLAGIDLVARLLQAGRDALPWLGSAAGWVPTLAWSAWAVGLVILLVVGLLGHGAIGRFTRGAARP